MSPLASTRARAVLALLALLGQLTPAVALPVYAATAPRPQSSCACVALAALAHSTCTPEAHTEKRGCCGCCDTKDHGAPATCNAPRTPAPDAPSVKAHDACTCAKPNPAAASEPAVPAELPVPVAVPPEAEPHVPQSAPSAPACLPAPPAPPPRV